MRSWEKSCSLDGWMISDSGTEKSQLCFAARRDGERSQSATGLGMRRGISLGSALAAPPWEQKDRAGLCCSLGQARWAVKACCEGCEHPSVAIAFEELAKGRGKLARCSSDFFSCAALGGGEGKDSFLTAKIILCLKFEYPLPLTKTLLLQFLQNNISLFHMHWRVPLHSKLQWMYPEQSWKVIAVIIVCHLLLSQTFSSPVNK